MVASSEGDIRVVKDTTSSAGLEVKLDPNGTNENTIIINPVNETENELGQCILLRQDSNLLNDDRRSSAQVSEIWQKIDNFYLVHVTFFQIFNNFPHFSIEIQVKHTSSSSVEWKTKVTFSSLDEAPRTFVSKVVMQYQNRKFEQYWG